MSYIENYLDARIVKTKRKMHKALLILMDKNPLDHITIKEIVEEAGINRGTFYNHYQTKKELLDEIIDHMVSELIELYREPYRGLTDFSVQELPAGVIQIFQSIQQNAIFYRQLVTSEYVYFFQSRLQYAICQAATYDYKFSQPIDQRLQASFYAHALAGMIVDWVREDFTSPPTYMSTQLLNILLFTGTERYSINEQVISKKAYYLIKGRTSYESNTSTPK